jgi:hypothetical protein
MPSDVVPHAVVITCHPMLGLCICLLSLPQEKLEEMETEAERPDELEETPDVPDADMM